jgi:hypothetical protein
VSGQDWLVLTPPVPGEGEGIEIHMWEEETALLRAGWTIRVLCHWDLDGSDPQLEEAAVAIMDGQVEEIAELDGDGVWVGVDSSLGRTMPNAEGPVTRHVRRLRAWRAA